MHISSGRVVYLRSVQPAQYETKKAEVELTFSLAEGEELGDHLNYVSSLAMARAHQMVGIAAPDVVKEQTAAADTAGKAIIARAAKAELLLQSRGPGGGRHGLGWARLLLLQVPGLLRHVLHDRQGQLASGELLARVSSRFDCRRRLGHLHVCA